jgi:Tfp pilus assembly PilM family ATPase
VQLISSALSYLPSQLILVGEKVISLDLVTTIRDRFNIKTKIADPFCEVNFFSSCEVELIRRIPHLMLISFGLVLRVGDYEQH